MLRFSTAFSVPGTGWGAAMLWWGWVGALVGSRSHQMPPEHVLSVPRSSGWGRSLEQLWQCSSMTSSWPHAAVTSQTA